MGLAQVQRQLPQVVAIECGYIEGVELDLVIVLPAVQPIEVGDPEPFGSRDGCRDLGNWCKSIQERGPRKPSENAAPVLTDFFSLSDLC